MTKNQRLAVKLSQSYFHLFDQKPYELIVVMALSACLLMSALFLGAVRTGDGAFYFSMLISMAENGNVALTKDIVNQVFERTGVLISGPLSNDGLNRPFHFFAYSALNIPVYKILQFFNIDTLKTFQITNAILIAFSISYILFSSISVISRWTITAGFLLSTAFNYFQWTHPELLTATTLLVSSVALLERRYIFSVLFATIGSLQNPSAIFLIPFAMTMQIFDLYYKSQTSFCNRKTYFSIGCSFIIALFSLIPYAWSYLHFSAFSPIVKWGFIDYDNINLDRFLSFLFDLNQGLVIGLPMLLYLIPVALMIRLLQMLNERRLTLQREDTLLLCFILIVLPTLGQINWNSDQAVFLRYASWAGMLVLVWGSVTLSSAKRSIYAIAIVPALVIQLFMFTGIGSIAVSRTINYISFKPWVVRIWNAFPHFYNPIPEIFYERLNGKENSFTSPLVLYTDGTQNTILRILSKQQDYEAIESEVCGKGAFKPIDNRPSSKPQIRVTELGLNYLTGRLTCIPLLTPGQIWSHEKKSGFVKGWNPPEPTHRWSQGKESMIAFNVKDKTAFTGILKLDAFPLGEQHITIMINETEVYSGMLTTTKFGGNNMLFNRSVLVDGSNTITFKLPSARLPENGDRRILALGFRSIQIH